MGMLLKLELLLAIFATLRRVTSENEVKVCLQGLGCLLGREMPGYGGGEDFEAFLGVPYAQPPIGNFRFRKPKPVESWPGNLMAKEAKPNCKQRVYFMANWPIMGDEDCLYMNIYRPKVATKSLLPVLVYIHGGGYFSGSANPIVYGPEYFMETREVLVVVMAYRLGPFGFLSSGTSELPGNFGLKDQYLALVWLHEHIAEFGGDPKEITLFGHSAGGSSVHFHMMNAKTKGLFKRAIVSSGSALAPFTEIVDKPLEQLQQMAQALGIDAIQTLTPQELADKLRTIDADKILQAGDVFKFWFNYKLFNYRPVIENSSDINAYLVEHPYETISKGNYELRPWLTGIASYVGEGAPVTLKIYEDDTLRNEFNQDFDNKLKKLLDLQSEKRLQRLIDEYMNGVHELNPKTRDGFFELFSDYHFYYPLYRALKQYVNYADVDKYPVYIYKFSYRGPYTYAPLYAGASKNRYSTLHMDDTIYQFRQSALFPDFEKESIDHQLLKEFVRVLLEFVKTGKPLYYDEIGSCSKEQFLTTESNGMCKYLEYVNTNNGYARTASDVYRVDRMKFWDALMDEDF